MTAYDAPAFDQGQNLDLAAPLLEEIMALLPPDEVGLCLIAAGLDLLPAARCAEHYRGGLLEVRREVDRLLGELGATH